MNSLIESLNVWGQAALQFAWPMLWQSSLLIVVVFALDYALRRKVRAAVRYALWFIVLVKLVLPPTLALPTSVAWWVRQPAAVPAVVQPAETPAAVVTYTVGNAVPLPAPAAPTVPPPVLRIPISGGAWALIAWGAITLGLFFWLGVRWRYVARRAARSAPASNSAEGGSLDELLDAAKRLAGARQRARLRLVDGTISPAVCGLFRPVILLPRSLVEQLPSGQLKAVLLHEVIHLRRRDVWANCLQTLLQILYWWHPLLWLANARIRRLREEAVDDAVMLALADESDAYATTLLEVAKLAFHRPLTALGLVGILESRRGLRARIERLMNFKTPGRAGLSIVSLLGIVAFTALALPMGEAPEKPIATSPAPAQPAAASSTDAGPTNSSVVTNSRPIAIKADSIEVDAITGIVKATGNVVIQADGKEIFADSARFDRKSGELTFSKARMSLPQGSATFERMSIATSGRPVALEWSPPPAASAPRSTNADPKVVYGERRQAIQRKLDQIRLDRVAYDHQPLGEVLDDLSKRIRKLDPEKRGVNFLVDSRPPALQRTLAGAPVFSTDGETPTTSEAIDSLRVTIDPPLIDVRAVDVLQAIIIKAEKPLKWRLEDYAVILSLKGNEPPSLFVRRFAVDPQAFEEALRPFGPFSLSSSASDGGIPSVTVRTSSASANPAVDSVSAAVQRFFAAIGVDMSPENGKSVFYSTSGGLMVRATAEDLDRIEMYIKKFLTKSNATSPAPETQSGSGPLMLYDGFEYNGLSAATVFLDTVPGTNTSRAVGMNNWTVDGVNQLNSQWFYYRDGTNFVPAPSIDNTTGNTALSSGSVVLRSANSTATIDLDGVDRRPSQWFDYDLHDNNRVSVITPADKPIPSSYPNATNLYVKAFKVNPDTFRRGLVNARLLPGDKVDRPINPADATVAVQKYVERAGVVLNPPKELNYILPQGVVYARASLHDLELIGDGVRRLNTGLPQIQVKARFVEVAPDDTSVLRTWAKPAGAAGTNSATAVTFESTVDKITRASTNAAPMSVLTRPQWDAAQRALEKLPTPAPPTQVLAGSGDRALIRVVQILPVIRGLNTSGSPDVHSVIETNPLARIFQMTNMPFGRALDLIATIDPDGSSIDLSATVSLTTFMGYDDAGRFMVDGKERTLPLARIEGSCASVRARLEDGQTMVLGGLIEVESPGAKDGGQPSRTRSPASRKRNVIVFLTATIEKSADSNQASNTLSPR